FARGQRHDFGSGHAACDFATGMRTSNVPSVAGDFATGMRTSHRRLTLGDFATGMRTTSAPGVVDAFTRLDTTLAAAARCPRFLSFITVECAVSERWGVSIASTGRVVPHADGFVCQFTDDGLGTASVYVA